MKQTDYVRYTIIDNMDNEIAVVFNKRDAVLIEQLPNMVMILQRVKSSYEKMFATPGDSPIYSDLYKILDDAEYKEVPTS